MEKPADLFAEAGCGAPFVLAPLAGVSDRAFRRICLDMGAAASCTEMISVKGLQYKNPKTEELLDMAPEDGPTGIQLFGTDLNAFSFAVGALHSRPNAFIDINMGCPVPKVVNCGEGSALLKNPRLASEIVRSCVEAEERAARASGTKPKPVTVKMRTGFSAVSPAAGEIGGAAFAKLLRDSGASALAVHGRTRDQYYSGKADWLAIKRIKEAVGIPVIGNGDVFSAEDGMRMMEETGCDWVMVGRGALGNPWIFRELNAAFRGLAPPPRPDAEELMGVITRHIETEVELKGEYRAVREMRKHISWYTKGLRGAAALRNRVNNTDSLSGLFEAVSEIKKYFK